MPGTGRFASSIEAIEIRINHHKNDLESYEGECEKYRGYVDKYTVKCNEMMLHVAHEQTHIDNLKEAQEHLTRLQEAEANDTAADTTQAAQAATDPADVFAPDPAGASPLAASGRPSDNDPF